MALIYVVEDDKSIQEIETFALTSSGYQARGYDNATSFYQALEREIPDLIILDIMLPDEDGLNILKRLRGKKETMNIPIIMVTAKTTEIDKVKGLDNGADDYVTKPFGVMELIARVKAVLRRMRVEEKSLIYRIGKVCMDEHKHSVTIDGERCELTYKEYELLKLLMSNAGVATSRQEILDKVWGTDFEGESRSLDMHIKTLRQKLKDEGSLIKTVRNVGYRMDYEEEN